MKIFACFPVLLLVATSAAAQPIVSTAPTGDTRSIAVSYSDLNLGSESGLARLDSRLRAAARWVCDVRSDNESLLRKSATSRCFDDALDNGREMGRQVIAARQSGTQLAAASVITMFRP